MEMNKLCIPIETTSKSTALVKPISEIAKIISNEYLKQVELNEYCKIFESDLSKFQNKVQTLVSAKNESNRIKADYKTRNKINVTNSKSLRQALNELYKYKAEMKSCFIATEKALKLKRIKYSKILSEYDSAWKEALKEYNADLVFIELIKIQQENSDLEREIEGQTQLSACTVTEFNQLKENIERTFYEKIVEFSKTVTKHSESLKSKNRIRKDESLQTENAKGALEFKLFDGNIVPSRKNSFGIESNDTYSVDVSVFDDIMAPSESLESQNLEEDGYSFIQSDGKQLSDVSKDQEEDLEYLKNYQQKVKSKSKELNPLKANSIQGNSKATVTEENESQYFKQQTSETQNENHPHLERQDLIEENWNKQTGNNDAKFDNNDEEAKKVNSVISESAVTLFQTESEDDTQMECEESTSERSYEKQFNIQKETYESQYQKASSVSSEEFSNCENQNENAGPSFKPFTDEESSRLKPRPEAEKNEFKSFAGFFTLGKDHEIPTPSIFKLF